MFFQTSLTLAAAAAMVSAAPATAPPAPAEEMKPAVILSMKHAMNVTSIKNLVAKGQARLNKINGGADIVARDGSGTVINDISSYLAPMSIGGKTWDLIVDTGSSNTWCGAQSRCEGTSTGKSTGGRVSVSYGSGSFSGSEYTDVVEFGGLTVRSQSIGAASSAQGFQGVDGILGLGPVELTESTVSNVNSVPTFMDNLYKQGSISSEVLGVYFAPVSGSATSASNGELTLGGVDSSKYSGSITYLSKARSGSSSPYWGLTFSSFTLGNTNLGGSNSAGIVDTGTTLIYIPTSAYNKFLSSAASGGTTDYYSGLAAFNSRPSADFSFTVAGQKFTLTPEQYLVPQAQYANFGLEQGKYYAWINDGGASGVNTIIGQKFLENYYSVYDTTRGRIGFAKRR